MELSDSEMAELGDIYDTTDWNATVLRLSVSPMVSPSPLGQQAVQVAIYNFKLVCTLSTHGIRTTTTRSGNQG